MLNGYVSANSFHFLLTFVFGHESQEGDDAKPLQKRIRQMHGTHIVEHAQKIGLGSLEYELITLE